MKSGDEHGNRLKRISLAFSFFLWYSRDERKKMTPAKDGLVDYYTIHTIEHRLTYH